MASHGLPTVSNDLEGSRNFRKSREFEYESIKVNSIFDFYRSDHSLAKSLSFSLLIKL